MKVYGAKHFKEISAYYSDKKDLYKKGSSLPSSKLMNKTLNKCLKLVDNGPFNSTSATEKKMVALQVKFKKQEQLPQNRNL